MLFVSAVASTALLLVIFTGDVLSESEQDATDTTTKTDAFEEGDRADGATDSPTEGTGDVIADEVTSTSMNEPTWDSKTAIFTEYGSSEGGTDGFGTDEEITEKDLKSATNEATDNEVFLHKSATYPATDNEVFLQETTFPRKVSEESEGTEAVKYDGEVTTTLKTAEEDTDKAVTEPAVFSKETTARETMAKETDETTEVTKHQEPEAVTAEPVEVTEILSTSIDERSTTVTEVTDTGKEATTDESVGELTSTTAVSSTSHDEQDVKEEAESTNMENEVTAGTVAEFSTTQNPEVASSFTDSDKQATVEETTHTEKEGAFSTTPQPRVVSPTSYTELDTAESTKADKETTAGGRAQFPEGGLATTMRPGCRNPFHQWFPDGHKHFNFDMNGWAEHWATWQPWVPEHKPLGGFPSFGGVQNPFDWWQKLPNPWAGNRTPFPVFPELPAVEWDKWKLWGTHDKRSGLFAPRGDGAFDRQHPMAPEPRKGGFDFFHAPPYPYQRGIM